MRHPLPSFLRTRRAAIAIITAVSMLPLIMIIALSIDYSFYTQARAQFMNAGDASAIYAIREATATYQLEINTSGVSNATAISDAQTVGNAAGAAWFTAQLATLPTAYVSGASPTVGVTSNANLTATNPAGFTASVGYTGIYPPFFNPLFHRSSNWDITGTSSANSSYSYVELLILMDTSSSMLVSADPTSVQTMDDNTVCVPNAELSNAQDNRFTPEADYVDTSPPFVNWSKVQNLTGTGTGTTAACANGMNDAGASSSAAPGSAWAPCGFACHISNSTYTSGGTTYYADFYGLARKLGVQLKTDVVFSSLESILSTMSSSEQVGGQFTVGIYQFNDSACPIVDGGSGDTLPEATSNLSGALTTIQNDDYNLHPTETAFPLLTQNAAAGSGIPAEPEYNTHTDFPTSVGQLISGSFACGEENAAGVVEPAVSGTALASPPSNLALLGTQAKYPERNIFIITDGMEDTSPLQNATPGTLNPCGRVEGEMAGIYAEATGSTAACDLAICSKLKNLGFTVYVLQIGYPSTQVNFYYDTALATSDDYINQDFPTLSSVSGGSGTGTNQQWNEGYNLSGAAVVSGNPVIPPNQQGLEACASASQDYFQASSSTAITTAMSQMLNSALSAAVRITN